MMPSDQNRLCLARTRNRARRRLFAAACAALVACSPSGDLPTAPGQGPSNGANDSGVAPGAVGGAGVEAGVAPAAPDAGPTSADAAQPDIERSVRSSLQWKRYAALQNDLSQALDLPKDALCNEFGVEPCIDKVHLFPLGGNDPFAAGLLEPSSDTLVTTGTVLERVVLSACLAKIEQERALGKPGEVFALDLAGAAPAPDAPQTRALVTGLYRRLLARDVAEDELALVASLTRDAAGAPVSATTFAATACMVVGTTTEFLFF
jgi:hypothetical protein